MRTTRIGIWARSLFQSEFRRNALWYTGLTGFQRVVSMVQTILIARALGITEYGVYGLLFGTIGLAASAAGLQMGLTATVFVARYRHTEKAKAAGVISVVGRFGWLIAIAVLVVAAPFTTEISRRLLHSADYSTAVLVAIVFVGASIVSGIQDGVAEGFEIFGPLAKVKAVIAIVVLAGILPMAWIFGLTGVLLVALGGIATKYVVLGRIISHKRSISSIPRVGAGTSFHALVSGFALPSMLVSLGVGAVTWLGMFMLSKQHAGFDDVAIVNTGLQWRGPLLLLTSSIGAVAVPAFSRMHASQDIRSSNRLRQKLSLINLAIAGCFAVVLVAGSGVLLPLYGNGFAAGRLAFTLIILSTIPNVVARAHMEQMVGAARMWHQLWLHVPYLIVMYAGFALLIPKHQALGYAASLVAGNIVFLAFTLFTEFIALHKRSNDASG